MAGMSVEESNKRCKWMQLCRRVPSIKQLRQQHAEIVIAQREEAPNPVEEAKNTPEKIPQKQAAENLAPKKKGKFRQLKLPKSSAWQRRP